MDNNDLGVVFFSMLPEEMVLQIFRKMSIIDCYNLSKKNNYLRAMLMYHMAFIRQKFYGDDEDAYRQYLADGKFEIKSPAMFFDKADKDIFKDELERLAYFRKLSNDYLSNIKKVEDQKITRDCNTSDIKSDYSFMNSLARTVWCRIITLFSKFSSRAQLQATNALALPLPCLTRELMAEDLCVETIVRTISERDSGEISLKSFQRIGDNKVVVGCMDGSIEIFDLASLRVKINVH